MTIFLKSKKIKLPLIESLAVSLKILSRAVTNEAATVRFSSTRGSLSVGRGVSSGALRFSMISSGLGSSIEGAGFSGSAGFTFEWVDLAQPGILRNSLKSVDFLLQQDQPLRAS
jgi:hypothetical protein